MAKLEKECPRCKGERGFWRTGIWYACITCKTQGKVRVASKAEIMRLERSVTHPTKVSTKQREKGR